MQTYDNLECASNGFLSNIRTMPEGTGVLLCADYDEFLFSPVLFETLQIARPDTLNQAVAKRQAEFLAGRTLARLGQIALGLDTAQVLIGPDRAPVWPKPMVGSISHSKGRCACLLMPKDHGVLPGLDIEAIASGNALKAILHGTVTAQDTNLLEQADDLAVAATLCFSAKETLYKSLYPEVRCFFGFDQAQLCALPEKRTLRLELIGDISEHYTAGMGFDIRFETRGSHVLTWRY
jgi:4'-phosphopantetheinyl transferase EntD